MRSSRGRPSLGLGPPSSERGRVVTPFFLRGTSPGRDTDRAYDDLRARAESRTGRPTSPTRIHVLSCRREGTDSETRIGERDPCIGATVKAIFKTYEGYAVVCDDGRHVDLRKRQIYAAIAFD